MADMAQMFDMTSTPLLVTLILGVVGLAIPIIDSLKKERGSNNKLYSSISFGALLLTIGIIIFKVISGEQIPTIEFGGTVLADDLFGSSFGQVILDSIDNGNGFILELYEE